MGLGPFHGATPRRGAPTALVGVGPWDDDDERPSLSTRRLHTPGAKQLPLTYHQQVVAFNERSARIASMLLPHAPTANAAKMAAARVLASQSPRPIHQVAPSFRQSREPSPRFQHAKPATKRIIKEE